MAKGRIDTCCNCRAEEPLFAAEHAKRGAVMEKNQIVGSAGADCFDGCPRITSRANPTVIGVGALAEKKYRDREGRFAFEGIKLLRDALASGIEIERVYVREDAVRLAAGEAPAELVTVVSAPVYDKLSFERSPEGVMCVAKRIDFLHKKVTIYNGGEKRGTVFLAASIRDPGNLGTIIRDANALGIDELILSDDCADLYNPRTVRASMGALFRQRIVSCADMAGSVRALGEQGYRVHAAALHRDAIPLNRLRLSERDCFLVGNEGNGLPSELIDAAGDCVVIPMKEGAESLNAAAAAAILMWETGKGSWIR